MDHAFARLVRRMMARQMVRKRRTHLRPEQTCIQMTASSLQHMEHLLVCDCHAIPAHEGTQHANPGRVGDALDPLKDR